MASPEDIITIYPYIDASKLENGPIIIGKADASSKEMPGEGVRSKVSEQLETLGAFIDFLYHEFEFEFDNADTSTKYFIKIFVYRDKDVEKDSFEVIGKDC